GVPVTHGRGRAVAVATGAATEMGRIAELLGTVQPEKTPLQERLEELGRWLGLIVLAVCGVVFLVGVLRGVPLFELFLTSVSLAVAAIPEGLPAVVTIVLALGVQRMARHHAIVRHLRAVEALGSVTVICTDKTGTLTENKMSVRRFLAGGITGAVAGEGEAARSEFRWDGEARPIDLRTLLEVAALCNNARLVEREGAWQVLGDPTEGALLAAAAKAGIRREALESEMPRRAEIPFDADRKRMSTLHGHGSGVPLLVNGPPDLL